MIEHRFHSWESALFWIGYGRLHDVALCLKDADCPPPAGGIEVAQGRHKSLAWDLSDLAGGKTCVSLHIESAPNAMGYFLTLFEGLEYSPTVFRCNRNGASVRQLMRSLISEIETGSRFITL